jgi:transcription termination/antitermination protein NusG
MSNWYALYVKPRKEKTVETLLAQRHFEAFSPSVLERRLWSDRIKTVDRTLFPGYVFCRFAPLSEERLPVLTVPGVNWIVGNGKDAVPVPDSQVDALRRAVASGHRVEPYDYLETGDRVEVLEGPLAGIEGILQGTLERRNQVRLVLSVELLRRSVAVEVPRHAVRPIMDRRITKFAELARASHAGGN